MTKGEQARLTAWRLKLLRQAADERNVARVCRRFGISRKSFYKWKRRHAEHGDAGLCDRSRMPLGSPRALAGDAVSQILYLRQSYTFGAGRITDSLRRFHQVVVAVSSVHRILTRHGMPRLPANQKHQPHPQTLATLREAPARASAADGREVSRAYPRHAEAAVSVH